MGSVEREDSMRLAAEDEVALMDLAEENVSGGSRGLSVAKRALMFLVLGAVVGTALFAARGTKLGCAVRDWSRLQGKSALDVDAKVALKASKLMSIKNRSLADQVVMNSMKQRGQEFAAHFDDKQTQALPASAVDAARGLITVDEVRTYRAAQKADRNTEAKYAFCAFNVLEAFVSVVGMGDDINGIIRVCPEPRDGESELACQVDGGILVAWVANAATKLAYAASNCATSLNVDAICSVGVTGLVSVMGELAATSSLAAATCTPTPPQLTTTQISVLGDQTVRNGRRLLIGQGPVGNGVQCAVDVGMVAANIANMGISIWNAVNQGFCGWKNTASALNKVTGVFDALCTVDIGGAIAYMSQMVTFINLIVVHCQDFLDVSALCGGSISGIITSAAAMVPYGAAVHAACAKGSVLKNPEEAAKINSLYTLPSYPRRLREEMSEMHDAMKSLKEVRKAMEAELGMNISQVPEYSADALENLLRLIDGGMDKEAAKSSEGSSWASECED